MADNPGGASTAQLVSGLSVALLSALLLLVIAPVLNDAELLWRIVAVVLLAIAISLAFVWSAGGFGRWWQPVVAFALLVAGVGVAALGEEPPPPEERVCVSQPVPSASIDGTVEIDNVRDGERVDSPSLVVGSYEDLDTDADLWIVVYAREADHFYPQSRPATLRGDRFEASMTLAGEKGESYEIMAFLADKNASSSLSSTLTRWERKRSFPGLTRNRLPAGLDEKDCVPVTLRVGPTTTTTTSRASTTTSSVATKTTTATAVVDQPIRAEMELAAGAGERRPRSEASSESTLWLHAGESANATTDVGRPGSYPLVIRYSNDNVGELETVNVAVDGETIGEFEAQDTGDSGSGWNVFLESPSLGPATLSAGPHVITISVSGGDGNGVEIDLVRS